MRKKCQATKGKIFTPKFFYSSKFDLFGSLKYRLATVPMHQRIHQWIREYAMYCNTVYCGWCGRSDGDGDRTRSVESAGRVDAVSVLHAHRHQPRTARDDQSTCSEVPRHCASQRPDRRAYIGSVSVLDTRYWHEIMTNNIETVKVCQFFFGISLPSVVLRSRTDKFEQKFSLCAEWWLS